MSELALRFPEPAPTAQNRWISLIEVALGTFIVIGHNVWHIVPNEVPILFILFWVSPRIRSGRWDLTMLRRPPSWGRTVGIAVVAASVILLGSELVVQPLAAHIWHSPQQVSSVIKSSSSNWKTALVNLAIVWGFAAFGEEIGYRGYLLPRAADLGGSTKLANLLAMIYVAVLFGFGHFYKGPEGVLDSAYSGLVLGTVFLLANRNLWAPILTHGLCDTVAVLAVFFGWAN